MTEAQFQLAQAHTEAARGVERRRKAFARLHAATWPAALTPLSPLPSERLAQGIAASPASDSPIRPIGPISPTLEIESTIDTRQPFQVKAEELGEISRLHEPFMAWLDGYADSLHYIHSRSDRQTTTKLGVPDFLIIGPRSRYAEVEFKIRKHPENWRPREQAQREWAEKSKRNQITHLVTNDLETAKRHVIKHCILKEER